MDTLPNAEFYEKVHIGNPGDVDFYLRITEGARHVLELGCGSARITLPIAERGTPIVGVEVNDDFVRRARERLSDTPCASVVHGDVRTLSPSDLILAMSPPPQSRVFRSTPAPSHALFDRIIIPYNTLYALGGRSGVLACFQLAEKCLSEDGELWCDVYSMEGAQEALLAGEEPPPDDNEPVARFSFRGDEIIVLESTELDPMRQHLKASYRAINKRGEAIASLLTEHDYLLILQLEELLDEAGLCLMLLSGSFDGSPFDEESDHLVFGAERKEAP